MRMNQGLEDGLPVRVFVLGAEVGGRRHDDRIFYGASPFVDGICRVFMMGSLKGLVFQAFRLRRLLKKMMKANSATSLLLLVAMSLRKYGWRGMPRFPYISLFLTQSINH